MNGQIRRNAAAMQEPTKGNARFMFHEQVLRDQKNLTKYALALAGFIMHRHYANNGTVRISLRAAERYLGIHRWHLQRARDLLVQRSHLISISQPTGVKGWRNKATNYAFGKGPEAKQRGGGGTSTGARWHLYKSH